MALNLQKVCCMQKEILCVGGRKVVPLQSDYTIYII